MCPSGKQMAIDADTAKRETGWCPWAGAPLVIMMLLAMIVLSLPPFLLDLFFTFNIALSLVLGQWMEDVVPRTGRGKAREGLFSRLLVVVYALRPLDFGLFPSMLLVATLLRLALNVASTRVVLLEGHTGPDAAGKVIEAFGEFVIGGNYAVGLVVLLILVIINFVVVTKGAGRVSEVSARFTLDAMPGKQMAIDADLNSGLIDQDEARRRREEVTSEADFYGAMDGASKFVRGDAIAGILILPINIIGGSLGGMAYTISKRKAAPETVEEQKLPVETEASETRELSWDDVQPVDIIGLEVGYRLIPLVDRSQGGQLMNRIKGVRKKLSQELGFLVQAVHIRDNLDLSPNAYRISLNGVPLGEAEIYPDRDLAINPGKVYGEPQGTPTTDPAFGLEAVWIDPGQRDHAQTLGYTVVDASTVVATHLSELLQRHAAELLGHEEVQQLLDNLAQSAPKLVEDLVSKLLPLTTITRVLQNLLEEGVSIRDIRTITTGRFRLLPRKKASVKQRCITGARPHGPKDGCCPMGTAHQ